MGNSWESMLIGATITIIVTSIASILAEIYKENRWKKNTKLSLVNVLTEEFRVFDKYLETLKNNYSMRKYFDLKVIEDLLIDINELNRGRASFSGLGNLEIQEKCIDIITSIKTFLIDTRIIENLYLNESARLRNLLESKPKDKDLAKHF